MCCHGGSEIVGEAVGGAVDDVCRAEIAEQRLLRRAAHDIDERDAVGGADFDKHLPEIRGGSGVDECAVPLGAHQFDEGKRGQRINEARRAIARERAVGQRHAHRGGQATVIGKARTAEQRDGAPEQCLRRRGRARRNDDTAAFIADGQRLADARRHRTHARRRDVSGDERLILPRARTQRRDVGGAEHEPEIGRVDRRGLHPDDDIARARLGQGQRAEPGFELGIRGDARDHGQCGSGKIGGHDRRSGLSSLSLWSAVLQKGGVREQHLVGRATMLHFGTNIEMFSSDDHGKCHKNVVTGS